MPIKWSISNSDTKAVITMKFEDFSPELELSRLINRRKAELEHIDARIAQMVLLMHERGQSWETIGRKLGITGEATRLRYAKMERPRQ